MTRTTAYDHQEQRVCDYLQTLMPDIGCGDDPIGFLIASHAMLTQGIPADMAASLRAAIRMGMDAGERVHKISDLVVENGDGDGSKVGLDNTRR